MKSIDFNLNLKFFFRIIISVLLVFNFTLVFANEQLAQQLAGGFKAPVPPGPSPCVSGSINFNQCQAEHNEKVNQYNKDLQIYNMSLQTIQSNNLAPVDNTARNQELATVRDSSATGALDEVQNKNKTASILYTGLKIGMAGAATAFLAKGTVCTAQCVPVPNGCCALAAGFFSLASAYFILSDQANNQAIRHRASTIQACQSYNQISSSTRSCETFADTGPNGQPINIPPVTINPITGACTPANSPGCLNAPPVGVAPPSVQTALQVSGFASGKKLEIPQVQPDGSIKVGGKTFSAKDFNNLDSLIAKGLSPSAAQAALSAFKKGGSSLAANIDAKDLLKDGKNLDPKLSGLSLDGLFGSGSGAGGGSGGNAAGASGVGYSEKLNASEIEDADRSPSSEGLVKNFNGELIGAEGDDIFKMMNRRYKLKTEQDWFLSPELAK